MLSHQQLRQILPQDYPFLMIDKVVEFKKGESLTAIKNITGNEWLFEGQSYQTGIFPETIIIEAAAQATLLLYHLSKIKDGEGRPKYIFGKATANFMNRVHIGDQLKIVTSATKMLDRLGFMDSKLSVDMTEVADIQIMYSVEK